MPPPHPFFDASSSAVERAKERGGVPKPTASSGPGLWLESIVCRLALIEIVDENVGCILDVLQERGRLDNTLIVFTSDHGEMLGERDEERACHFE